MEKMLDGHFRYDNEPFCGLICCRRDYCQYVVSVPLGC